MDLSQIKYSVADGIAMITLNRPDRMNAFTEVMMREMIAAFDAIDADDAVRAVIVTGEGRAFCAGADLGGGGKTFDYSDKADAPFKPDGSPSYQAESARDGGGLLTLRIFQCLKPVIAAINGPAVGMGATMTLPMDIRLASNTARMGFVFVRRGIVLDAAATYFLPRAVGISQAMEWSCTGRIFSPEEGQEGGLLKRVLPPEDLLPAANMLAREIADNAAPVSVVLTRQMLWRGLGMTHPMDAHRIDSRAILSRGRSDDAKEGVTSFLEKRSAIFPDKVSEDLPDFYPWWDEPTYG